MYPASLRRMICVLALWAAPVLLEVPFAAVQSLAAQSLEEQLLSADFAQLAQEAADSGDPQRGAVLFFQPQFNCSKCHAVGAEPSPLGPHLAQLDRATTNVALIEALLKPSAQIRPEFVAYQVVTVSGESVTGMLRAETADALTLQPLEQTEPRIIPRREVESVEKLAVSLMPAGQVNQLANRQQFLDLIRYLMEIRDGGLSRAQQLQPAASLIALVLPEYEQALDHAGMIGEWDDGAFDRGKAIYARVCQNCHGTLDQPGSLPTSLRFGTGKFKHGSDPHTMYQTLTRGFGFMAAQTWMVPSQKYDVIHYIREAYLKPHNPSQYTAITPEYLARLPRGTERGPAPSTAEPWRSMNYGPFLTHTYEIPSPNKNLTDKKNLAYKGIAIRLDAGAGGVSQGKRWMVFDADTLRMAAAWHSETPAESFVDWRDVQFNGEHNIHPTISGQIDFVNMPGPGWAQPDSGSLQDTGRVIGRDGLAYGPLPRNWGRFRGLYQHGEQVVLSYEVGGVPVLESPRWIPQHAGSDNGSFVRIFELGPRPKALTLRVAQGTKRKQIQVLPAALEDGLKEDVDELTLTLPSGKEPLRLAIFYGTPVTPEVPGTNGPAWEFPALDVASLDLQALTHGGPPRWPERLVTRIQPQAGAGPLVADVLTPPDNNPWQAQLRFSGLDFFADGSMAACTWDGDVWRITLDDKPGELHWQRLTTGLFQPLGLKIVNHKIHVTCRNQLAVLHDLNADGEIDFQQCLNNDHQVTEHFHEFAMGLQTDQAGNFYYAKSARHALPAIVPQHGTLLKISPDGEQTQILANGFRAANGVCLNPDGSFYVTDQEGHWNPKNRINWIAPPAQHRPRFYGNMFGYHDVTDSADSAMEPPLCWITNVFDRSPGELLWVNSQACGPLNGKLLNLSYGTGKVFLVLPQNIGSLQQGGMLELPIPPFPTGVMRGRFRPQDGQLYLCGLFSWAGSATQPGGLYRLRYTGEPLPIPTELRAVKDALVLTFAEPLATGSVTAEQVQLRVWSLKRSAEYGSEHYHERELAVDSVELAEDRKTVTIHAALAPTWCMEIAYKFTQQNGAPAQGVIHNTIHQLSE